MGGRAMAFLCHAFAALRACERQQVTSPSTKRLRALRRGSCPHRDQTAHSLLYHSTQGSNAFLWTCIESNKEEETKKDQKVSA